MNRCRIMSNRLIARMQSFPSRRKQTFRLHIALIIMTLAQFLCATSAQAQVRHTIIAATGTPAPAGGNYFEFLNTRVLNARGQVAFDARLGGPSITGVFVGDGTTTSTIALGGDPNPAAGNFDFVSAPSFTTGGGFIFNTPTGVFRADGGGTVALVQNGDPAPGGGNLFLSNRVANSLGMIAYGAFLTEGSHTEGIFRNNDNRTIAIGLDSTPAPTGGTFLFFGSPVMNDAGDVAFFAGMTGGSADFGIYRGDGGNITTIFAANQNAPGGGTFVDFGEPRINKRGQVAAVASLDNASGPFGVFIGDGTDTVAIALSGHPAPKGGNYATGVALQFVGPLPFNDHGQVAFGAFLTGGTSRSGIFRGDAVTTTAIALEGTVAPGTTGTFASFGDMKMGKDGSVAFIATLTQGVGGVDASNNIGIWVGASEADLRLLARTGEVIGGKTLTRPLNLAELEINEKLLVWLGRFSGNSTAIVATTLEDD